MHKKLFLIFSISFLLFSLAKSSPYSAPPKLQLTKKSHYPLLNAYLLGDKKSLAKNILKDYKTVNLLHLFTPSGLHMSSLIMLSSFFLKRWPWLQIVFCLFPFFLPGFYAIKRISLLRVAHLLNKRSPYPISFYWLLLLVFFLDFLLGTYSHSPFSFAASFLFLGILFSLKDSSVFNLAWGFFAGQVILSFFFFEPFTYLGFIPSFILTSFFSLLFPFYLIGFFVDFPGLSWLIDFYLHLVQTSSHWVQIFGWSFTTLPLLFFILLSFTKWKRWGCIFLVFHANPLLNFPIKSYQFPKPHNFEALDFKAIKRTKKGYSLKLENGDRCSMQLIPAGYYLTCY